MRKILIGLLMVCIVVSVQAQWIQENGTVYTANAADEVSIGASSVYQYSKLDVTGAYAGNKFDAQLHLHTTNNTYGMFLGSHALNYGVISQGGHYYSAGNYTALSNYSTGIIQNNGFFHFYSNSGLTANTVFTPTYRFTITNAGKVGIGSSSPDNRLVIEGSEGAASSLLIRNKSYGSTDNTGTASFQFAFANHIGPKLEAYKVSTNITGLKLYTEYGFNVPQLAMTFKPSASGTNIGIGTENPEAKFHLNGEMKVPFTWSLSESGFNNKIVSTGWTASTGDFITIKHGGNNTELNTYGIRITDIKGFEFGKNNFLDNKFVINTSGNVGIGKLTPTAKLHVNGTIISKEIKVEDVDGADFVFAPEYNLVPLADIEAYIKQNHHLPEVPSAAEMQANGVELGKMNMLLLQKIEELTLHMIEQQKEIQVLKSEMIQLKSTNK